MNNDVMNNDNDFFEAMSPYFPNMRRRIGKGKIKEPKYTNDEILEIYKNRNVEENKVPTHFDSYEAYFTWGS